MAKKPISIKRQRHTYPFIENGPRNRQTTYACHRNIPPAFSHFETPHVSGKRLLGAYQMAGGIFLSSRKSQRARATKPISPRGHVLRIENRNLWPPNDTDLVTVTSTDLCS